MGSAQCVPLAATCATDVTCTTQNRVCVDAVAGTTCGSCVQGQREVAGVCQPVLSCAKVGCDALNRNCIAETPSQDAVCGACVDGVKEINGSCVRSNCGPAGTAGSISATCATANEACASDANGASCGACITGFMQKLGACAAVQTCASLGCVTAKRLCTSQEAHADATCGACLAGFSDNGQGVCTLIPNATCASGGPNAIGSGCDSENRICVLGANGAACDACKSGYVANAATGNCDAQVACSALNCAATNQSCTATPNAHCDACVDGYTKDATSGVCRPVVTCASLTCPTNQACNAETASTDAFCRVACGASSMWNGAHCEVCPPCNATGEEGRYDTPSAAGNCICKTKPGYFYSVGDDVGTSPCDADQDGWVRESARTALESTDPAILTNARCTLRKIDNITVIDEAGESKKSALVAPLALYETDRNDDDLILRTLWAQRGLPALGTSGLYVSAKEVNRLTKFCSDPREDFNDNGIPDTEEWGSEALAPNFRPDQQPFNQFSYFAELNWGYYLAPSSGQNYGTYVIKEKSRDNPSAAPEEQVPVEYEVSDGSYWKQCTRYTDTAAATQSPPIGMDFASLASGTFSGMNHHSQFKCVVIDPQPDPALPNQMTETQVVAQGFRLNACTKAGDPLSPTDLNPAEPNLTCTVVDSTTVQPGDARWAAVPYIDYYPGQTQTTYVRGCINECIKDILTCPGLGYNPYAINPAAVTCEYDAANFGKYRKCDVIEVCDGKDNNNDGHIDEGNPGGGIACVTGLKGVCSPGHTNCTRGSIHCDQDVQPSAETCDNLDNNCDGQVDENNPESGGACDTGLKGACKAGINNCTNHVVTCTQTTASSPETCDGVDNDCDGTADNGINLPGCLNYYNDTDGDGWGVQGDSVCQCQNAAHGTYVVPKDRAGNVRPAANPAWDCCDTDNLANPGVASTSWFSSADKCSSYDYNCDGSQTAQFNTTSDGGCGHCCTASACCCGGTQGWSGGVATCGTTAQYWNGGCESWWSAGNACDAHSDQKQQSCN